MPLGSSARKPNTLSRPPRKKNTRRPARQSPALQHHLVALWRKLTASRTPPACDRFLARELRRLDGLPRHDRLWLGDILTDTVRFAALTVFCESWRRSSYQPGTVVAERIEQAPGPAGAELWRRLARLPAPIVFYWTFMRKRLTGVEIPAIAPPGPAATEVWRAVRDQAPTSADLATRALWAGLPPGLTPLVAARATASGWSHDQTLNFIDRHARRSPIWLRLYQPTVLAALRTELAAAGFSVQVVGQALEVRGEKGVYELPSYRAGVFGVQDLASQGIGDAVGARPGDLIWDCCAGAGGKSLQLATALAGRGTVHATDIHEAKLKDLRLRAARTRLENIQPQKWDGTQVPDFGPVMRKQGGFDRVLVDAPCSGSGTWRRNVDGRLRLTGERPVHLIDLQQQLLAVGAAGVRPGGRLVYATCSWLTAENEDVCHNFLDSHPRWRQVSATLGGNPVSDSDTTFWAVFLCPADAPPPGS